MRRHAAPALVGAAFLIAIACRIDADRPPELEPAQASLRKAAAFLWAQQSQDGGWHSATYGLLRSGQSLTAFVLDALLQVPSETHGLPPEGIRRAVAFIEKHTDSSGALGLADPLIPDYPNYGTALAVQALSRANIPERQQRIGPLVTYLRGQQFTEQNGWTRQDAPYGGWGMGGARRAPPDAGHVDLSMTRHALQALAASGVPSTDSAMIRAAVFVERCQNYDPERPAERDGGFFFSTVVLDANKAGHNGVHYRSYGTATADGILSLMALGRTAGDPRVQAAQRWLTRHHSSTAAPGFAGEAYQRWRAGLRFYYAGASAEVFEKVALNLGEGTVRELLLSQRSDGSWSNAENLVKEDDPLIATAFAVRALVRSK